MTDERPRSRLLLDVAAYVAARLVLVVVVAAALVAALLRLWGLAA